MSFQWVIDNAESISIDRRKVVGQTITRSGVVRTVGRGGQLWNFEVQAPSGYRYSDIRAQLSALDNLDRNTSAAISIQQNFLVKYQGNSVNYVQFNASWTQGQTAITLTSSPSTPSGYKFRAGDIIQLGTQGKVYSIVNDVPFNSNDVTLHRPVVESTATNFPIRVAENCQWTVYCTQMPTWTVLPGQLVTWSGPFIFTEVV